MEPKDFFRVILRRKRTLVTAMIIVVGVAMFGSMRKPASFGADCQVIIQAVGPDVLAEKGAPSIEIYSSFESIKAVIEAPQMAQKVADLLKVPLTRVIGRVNAALLPTTSIFDIKTVDSDQAFVSKLCNGYVAAIITDRRESAHKVIGQIRTTLLADQKELNRQYADVLHRMELAVNAHRSTLDLQVEQATILSQLRDYQIRLQRVSTQEQLIDQGGGQALNPAPPVGAKIGPDHKKDLLLAVMVGLIFGLAIAFLREYIDDTMRDKESIQRELGVPVLATMPSEGGVTGYVDPSSKAVESARTLRTNLASLGFPNELHALVVTSTLSKRRANTVANLAAAVAEAGRTVLVIAADFRNPRLHEHFGVGNAIGLSSVVRGQMSIDQAVRPVPGLDGVYLLPTGPQISNPGELLSSDAMDDLLVDARNWADAVIIDVPPVLTAADASVLGTMADGVVLVMSAGRTQREQAIEAKDQLVAGGANVLGIVLSGSTDQAKGKTRGKSYKDDEDDLPPLMPYGAWAGAGGSDWVGPPMYDTPALPPRRANVARARSTKMATRPVGSYRNGGGNGNGRKTGNGNGNGNGYARKTTNGNGRKTGNGNGNGNGYARKTGNGNGNAYARKTANGNGNGNGYARKTGNGNGHSNGGTVKRNGNGGASYATRGNGTVKRNGNGNGNTRKVVNGNGNGNGNGRGNGSSRKVVAARRTRRDW